MPRSRFTAALVLCLLSPVVACACLWDYDTLKMERARFPSALELITGKFLRHSEEFYQWRIKDRQEKLKAGIGDEFALRDDLAVAYDKTGQHDKAIDTILISLAKNPDRYETQANLGTFYIHSGQLEKGLEHIDKAMQINPDAHFGREKYQKALVEYVLSKRKDGKVPRPLAKVDRYRGGFVGLLKVNEIDAQPLPKGELQAALKGVQGIMKFGKHDSPVVLEVLGDLLLYGNGYHSIEDGKRLATRAFLKASYEATAPEEKEAYRTKAREALGGQTRDPSTQENLTLEELEQSFQQELADAKKWYAELREKEHDWIAEGKNPEAEFDRLYDQEPSAVSPEDSIPEPWLTYEEKAGLQNLLLIIGILVSPFLVLALLALGIVVVVKRRRRARAC
jgi:tetratricopeptide (TPR) repeat protein